MSKEYTCKDCFRFSIMNDENYCTGFGKIGNNFRICSSFILDTDDAKEDEPVQQQAESITLDDEAKEKFKLMNQSVTNLIKDFLQQTFNDD